VHGRFTVAPGNTNSLSLTVPSGFKKSGIYTLVSADNGVSGQFVASVGGLPSGASVLYNATTIQVSVPSGATAILFR